MAPEETVVEYFERVLREQALLCPYLRTASLHPEDFFSRAKRALFDTLLRLDALSRADPF